MQNYFILILFSVLVSTGWLFSQEDEKSTLIGGPTSDERALNIVADIAGNTYVGGIQDKKGLIVKQNAQQQMLWAKTLNFTTPNATDEVKINFMDLVGDTLFGCGLITQPNNHTGTFYFKLNAQTGAVYWSKFELASNGFFSCMRYANGKFFLTGGIYDGDYKLFGKVIAVSSQTGNAIWQTPLKRYLLPGAKDSIGEANVFISSTEMYNGKFYVTGYCSPSVMSGSGVVGPVVMPLVLGITETGTVFMEKWLSLPVIETSSHYLGTRIHLDSDHNLVITSIRKPFFLFDNLLIVTKLDLSGNVIFSRNYHPGNVGSTTIEAFNETADSYVLLGTRTSNTVMQELYTLEIDKSGNLQQAVAIVKPNTFHFGSAAGAYSWIPFPWGLWQPWFADNITSGNSSFVNNRHYFVIPEATLSNFFQSDINKIILNEELNEIEDCAQLQPLPTNVYDVPASLVDLIKADFPHTIAFQNGIILEDVPPFVYCANISLDLDQLVACGNAEITANHSGFTDPTFYWSNGTSGNSNTITVNTTDTIFVRVLDTKCCELFDTIVPNFTPSAFAMNLPADTTLCLPAGSSFTITPTFSNASSPVTYLWSNGSVGTSLSVNASGTYWLELSDSCVTRRDSIVVTMGAVPVIGNTGNVTVCENTFPISLSPTVSAGASVLWDDGTTALTRTVNGPGTYTLEATNDCGVMNASISVMQIDLPGISLGSVMDTCIPNGGGVVLSPVFTNTNNVVWSTGSTANQLTVSASGTYTVYASNACGTDSATVSVTLRSLPIIGNTANVVVCEGAFPATLNPTVSAGTSVVWDDSSTNISRSVNAPGTYTLAATNVCGTVNASITVSQTDLPTVQLIAAVDTCIQNGTSITLSPVFTGTTTVLWSDGSAGNQLSVFTSGTYTVYASNNCGIDSASSSVTINYFPELNLPATLDTCFEIGVGFAYTAQGSGGSYQWSSGSNTATEWISQEGMYSVTLTNQCGSVTKSMQVRRYTEVDLYFPNDSIKECSKHFAVANLQIETNYTLEVFAPNGTVVGDYLTESGWYLVHAFNPCAETWDSIYVNLQNEQFFYLPNSFTPNGDSHNDRFEFKGDNIVLRDVQIFNRWGEVVFTESGAFTGWDGTYRGEVCPDGIYAVHLIYEDCFGMPTEFNGHVNLVR